MKTRRGLSLIEILLAAMVLGVLGMTIQSMMVSTLKRVNIDRVSEAERHLVLDLLEFFSHQFSPVAGEFHAELEAETRPLPLSGNPPPQILTREFTVQEALDKLDVPDDGGEREILHAILESGGVRGLTLKWQRRIEDGKGNPRTAYRLDVLTIETQITAEHRGPRVASFRVFTVPNS